jgi:cytochrome c biogenesis protein CcmG/thiol:disulfide interchange protein DsbE
MTPLAKRLLFVLPVLLFAGLALYLALALRPDRDPSLVPSALVGKPVPPFDLPPLLPDRPGLAAKDLKGQVTLINFFASWCIPCRAEQPVLMRLTQEVKATLYGIAYKDKPEASRAFLAEAGDPFARVVVDASGRTAIDFGLYGVPETYVVDRQGIIRYRQVGPLDPETLTKTVLPLLAELAR